MMFQSPKNAYLFSWKHQAVTRPLQNQRFPAPIDELVGDIVAFSHTSILPIRSSSMEPVARIHLYAVNESAGAAAFATSQFGSNTGCSC